MLLVSSFKPETSVNTQESEPIDLVDQEIKTENKLYLAKENLSAQKVEEAEILSWWNSYKKVHSFCQVCKKVSFGTTIFCLF